MKREKRISWAVLALPLVAALPAVTAAESPEDEIRAADARRMAAMVRADVQELGSLLADELTYTHSSGQVETREQLLATISSGKLDYVSMVPSEDQVRVYGNTAVRTGRADVKVRAGGQENVLALRFTEVWVKGEGGWRLVVWQSTRLP
jgi:ketosteroid isomerase-like protein